MRTSFTRRLSPILCLLVILTLAPPAWTQQKPRARALGIPFEGTPGPLNAVTDVRGLEVGHTTLISGEGRLVEGRGPVRTGVTAILPQGKDFKGRLPAAWFSLNGNGEMTGTTWIDESGFLEAPILLTNTHSVGVARDALVEWGVRRFPGTDLYSLPVVAETYDGFLNDINGFHVKKEHVYRALEGARPGPVQEGSVGGGTGMMAYRFKAGIGTSSRVVESLKKSYTVGVLVQANFGLREQLRIAGVPVGKEITDLMPVLNAEKDKDGSIIVVVATDAPLLPHQLRRIVKRAALGLGRNGSIATNSSGDIFVAFSVKPPEVRPDGVEQWGALPNDGLDPFFAATVQATEEAVINALVAAETMKGINGNTVYALPHDRLRQILKRYNRLAKE